MQNFFQVAGVMLGGLALVGVATLGLLDKKYPQRESKHAHKECPVCHRCLICGQDMSSMAF